jgi:hypothetical protein
MLANKDAGFTVYSLHLFYEAKMAGIIIKTINHAEDI